MKLSLSQKERNKTVKFPVTPSGSKIEVITAGGITFNALLLYQSAHNRYEGNIKMYGRDTSWKQCAACAG